jgi:hypothetical protein
MFLLFVSGAGGMPLRKKMCRPAIARCMISRSGGRAPARTERMVCLLDRQPVLWGACKRLFDRR